MMIITLSLVFLLGFVSCQDDDVEFVNCPIVPRVPMFTYRDVSALGIAVLYNSTKDVETFLDSGCDVNYDGVYREQEETECHNPIFETLGLECRRTIRYSGYAPLNLAALHGTVETVRTLLKVPGIDVNKSSTYPSTPLTNAAFNRNYEMMKLLLEAGADVNAIDGVNFTALYTSSDGDIQTVKLLVEAGANVNFKSGTGRWTPLMRASDKEKIEIVEYLISNGADVNARSLENFTALYQATVRNNTKIVELLVEAGADVNIRSGEHLWSPLTLAAYEGYEWIGAFFISKGVDVDAQTSDGSTALYVAARNNLNIVRMLLEAGADENIQKESGWSALMMAAYEGQEEVVNYLIDNGADVNATKSDGCSAVSIAVEQQNLAVVKILVEAGADIDVQCSYDDTSPLMQAALDGNEDIVAYLKEQGANLDLFNTSGETALDIAADQGYDSIVDILKEK